MIENIVRCDARAYPLMDSLCQQPSDKPLSISQGIDSENEGVNRALEMKIDQLVPYVDLARMAREAYDKCPSIQHGARMREKVEVLLSKVNDIVKSEDKLDSAIWKMLKKRYPKLDWICEGTTKEGCSHD